MRIQWLSILVIDLLAIRINHRNHHHLAGLLHTWLHHASWLHQTWLLLILLVVIDWGAQGYAWIHLLLHLHLLPFLFILLLFLLCFAKRSIQEAEVTARTLGAHKEELSSAEEDEKSSFIFVGTATLIELKLTLVVDWGDVE